MKRLTISYWIVTGLMALLMGIGSLPDVLMTADARAIFAQLGYPLYFMPYIGVWKLLGVLAVLIPGYARLKEWAYAGLFFDTVSAFYSGISVNAGPADIIPPIVATALIVGSYLLYRRRLYLVQRTLVLA